MQDGFSILLPEEDVVRMFRENLKLSCIVAVPQVQHQTRLILNLSGKLDEGTPGVNDITDREVAPELMLFGRAFRHVLQVIWEADPAKGPIRLSKLDVTVPPRHPLDVPGGQFFVRHPIGTRG